MLSNTHPKEKKKEDSNFFDRLMSMFGNIAMCGADRKPPKERDAVMSSPKIEEVPPSPLPPESGELGDVSSSAGVSPAESSDLAATEEEKEQRKKDAGATPRKVVERKEAATPPESASLSSGKLPSSGLSGLGTGSSSDEPIKYICTDYIPGDRELRHKNRTAVEHTPSPDRSGEEGNVPPESPESLTRRTSNITPIRTRRKKPEPQPPIQPKAERGDEEVSRYQ